MRVKFCTVGVKNSTGGYLATSVLRFRLDIATQARGVIDDDGGGMACSTNEAARTLAFAVVFTMPAST